MQISSQSPIGIFDSGIGGLTVAHAIRNRLPNESLIYYGDTAHLPYGDKSEAAIQAYSVKITQLLLDKGCKAIVIACNSASSAAYELLKEYTGSRAKIINVIDPMVHQIVSQHSNKRIGLIGTKRTVNSNIYKTKIEVLGQGLALSTLATPLLVPMIEEGFFNNKISGEIIENYLKDPELDGIEALILGCTHYPLIKKEIEAFYNGKVEVLDSSEVVAIALEEYLSSQGLHNKNGKPSDVFLVSDYTASFEASSKLFFRKRVELERYPLWD